MALIRLCDTCKSDISHEGHFIILSATRISTSSNVKTIANTFNNLKAEKINKEIEMCLACYNTLIHHLFANAEDTK